MADTIINTGTQIPEYERKKTGETIKPGDSTSTESTTVSPEALEAQAAQKTAADAQVAAQQRETEQAKVTAGINSDAATQTADIVSHQAADQDFVMGQAAEEIAQAKDYAKRKQAELDGVPAPKLFHHGDNWGNVMRGVALAMGGIGDAIQRAAMVRIGKAPPTIDTVGDIINSDLQRQREHIETLKDGVVRARTGIADANEARRQMLADVELRGVAMLNHAKALAAARLAAQGKTAAEIEGDKNIAGIKEKIADKQAAFAEHTLGKITKKVEAATKKTGYENVDRAPTTTNKGPTESQAKLADLSAGLLSELATIKTTPTLTQDELAKVQDNEIASARADAAGPIGSVAARAGRAAGVIPRTKYDGLSPDAQKAMNAWDSAVELRARQLTGAGMPEQEAIREARTLGFSPGDTPEMMQQKINRLEASAKRGIELSGSAGGIVSGGAATKPSGEGASPPKAEDARGKAIRLLRANPNRPGAKAVMKKFGISQEEVSGGG